MAKTDWNTSDIVQPSHLNQIGEEINTATTTAESVKAAFDAHAESEDVHGATSVATPSTLVKRDGNGRFKVSAPVAEEDVARKAEVDSIALTGENRMVTNINGVDLNTLNQTGFYAGRDLINRPSPLGLASWLFVEVYSRHANSFMQRATLSHINSPSQISVYTRVCADGSFGEWVEVSGYARRLSLTAGTYTDLDVSNVDVINCNTSDGDIIIDGISTSTRNDGVLHIIKTHTANSINVRYSSAKGIYTIGGVDAIVGSEDRYSIIELRRVGPNWFGGALRKEKITKSTSDPSGGMDGDIWIKYTP